MCQCLTLRIAAVEGALLRVLGTVERRGFRVLSCHIDADGPGGYRLRLDVDGQRDPQLLCRQLARLLDVRDVAVAAAEPVVGEADELQQRRETARPLDSALPARA